MKRHITLGIVVLYLATYIAPVLADTTTTNINNETETTSTVTSTNTNTNNNTNTNTSTSTSTNTNTNNNTSVNTNTNNNTNNTTYNGTSNNTNTNTNTNNNTTNLTSTTNNTNNSTNTNNNTNVTTSTSNNTNNSNVTQSVNSNSNSNSTSQSTNVNQNTSNNTNTNKNESTSKSDVNTNNKNENINKNETTIKSPPPSAIAPSIGSSYSQDLCTTGIGGAVQTQVFGISAGKSVRDENCERIKLSKTLYDMGMKVAAVSLMCQDKRVWEAMNMAGTPCPFEGMIGDEAKAEWKKRPDKLPEGVERARWTKLKSDRDIEYEAWEKDDFCAVYPDEKLCN